MEGTISFRVKGNFDSVLFVYNLDGEKEVFNSMEKQNGCYFITLNFSRGLYWYYFKTNVGYISNYGLKGQISDKIVPFQLSVYDKEYMVPNTIKGGIIYQIFPDRFNRTNRYKQFVDKRIMHENLSDTPSYLPDENGKVWNNDFFGGDINGIIEKIPYLKQLNVSAIYLNPIFKAYSNHRYDTGDYFKIDELLGTEEDLIKLIKICNDNGIKIILDGVFNHTGDDSVYFNKYNNYDGLGAYQSKESKYNSWYEFTKYPNEYRSWWGITTLPSTNKNCSEFIDFITGENGVISYYTKLGVSGWRLDVVDELPSHFVKKIRTAVKNVNKDAIIIGEVWEDASNKISYDIRREYFLGYELDSVMNYPLKNAIIEFVKNNNSKYLSKVISEQIDHYPSDVRNSLMNILSTHDTARLISALSNKSTIGKTKTEIKELTLNNEELSDAINKLKIATMLQYTIYGVPSIYYGDEVGMQGYCDPFNRKFFPWDNINNDILSWYIKLGKLRENYSCFSDGEFFEIYNQNNCYIFSRKDENSEILVCVNQGKNDIIISYSGILTDVLCNRKYKNTITVKNKEYYILTNEKERDN